MADGVVDREARRDGLDGQLAALRQPGRGPALSAFERETDPDGQHRLCAEMQRVFVAEAPAIPLYPGPSWAEYNVSRFTGFPSKQDPYADPSPNKFDLGECLLVLTTLAPREVAP